MSGESATGRPGNPPPDPEQASDLPEFVEALRRLRVWAGNPSFRTLAKQAGPRMRPPQDLAQSTVGDMFDPRRRRLNQDLVVAVVRALGLDEPAVDRWRAACVRVHAEPGAVGSSEVLRQLPRDLSTFTGREADVDRLLTAAHADSSTVTVLAVDGMAGVGKTRLALHVAHRLLRDGRFRDGQLYADLRGFDSASERAEPADVLDAFLRSLGVPGQKIPATLDARAAMFRDRMHDLDALILLDNAADEQQVHDLVPAGSRCVVLVTSRRSLAGLDGAILHRLSVLSREESVDLLARVAGAERIVTESDAATAIAELCGRLPLALTLTAAHLRSRPTWTAPEMRTRLEEGRLSVLAMGGHTIRTIFDLSLQGLSEQGRNVFRLLGLHPGSEFAAAAISALAGMPPRRTEQVIDELLDHHLLEEVRLDRYTVHDLLREYSRETLDKECGAATHDEALARLIDHYCRTASCAVAATGRRTSLQPRERAELSGGDPVFSSVAQALGWLDLERRNLLGTAQTAVSGWPAKVSGLSQTLAPYLRDRGYPSDALRLHDLGANAAQRCDDQDGLWRNLFHVGNAHGRRGDFGAARRSFETALAICDDPLDRAAIGRGLGQVENEVGDCEKAIALLKMALETSRAGDNGYSEISDLSVLSYTCFLAGRYGEALDYIHEALALPAAPEIAPQQMVTLSVIQERIGDLDSAEKTIRVAVDECEAMGNDWVAAHALNVLGRILGHRRQDEQALTHLNRALTLHRDLGNAAGEADTLLSLGAQYLRRSQTAEAEPLLRQALALAESLGSARRTVEALCHVGDLLRATGERLRALDAYNRALQTAIESNDPYWQARAHEGLCRTYLGHGDGGHAREHFDQAAELYRALGLPNADDLPKADSLPSEPEPVPVPAQQSTVEP